MDPVSQPPVRPQLSHFFSYYMKKELLWIVIAFILGVLLTMALSPKEKDGTKQTVTITGVGTMEVPADQAIIYASISVAQNSEKEAYDLLAKTNASLKKKLLAIGLKESQFTIGSSYVSPPYKEAALPQPIGITLDASDTKMAPPPVLGARIPSNAYTTSYVGSNTFDVTLSKDQLALADKVMEAYNDTDYANASGPPTYSIKNYSGYTSQVREKALLDAKDQVEKIAKINNLRVAKVLSINEEKNKNQSDPYYNNGAPYLYVDPGTKKASYSLSYKVVYELQPGFFSF